MAKVYKDPELTIGDDVKRALQAAGRWEQFSKLAFSHRREYVQWIEGAKQPETRARRIQKMCDMLASGQKVPR